MEYIYTFYEDRRFKEKLERPFDPVAKRLASVNPLVATLKPVPDHNPKEVTPYWINDDWILKLNKDIDDTQSVEFISLLRILKNSVASIRIKRESVFKLEEDLISCTLFDISLIRERISYMDNNAIHSMPFKTLESWKDVTVADLHKILSAMQAHLFRGYQLQKDHEDRLDAIRTIHELREYDIGKHWN